MNRIVLLGNSDSPRVTGFQAALAEAGRPPATVVAWSDLLARQVVLADVLQPGDLLRIESPGRDFEVERQLLTWGADEPDADGDFARLSARAIAEWTPDKGEILCPRQWYLGFRRVLREIAATLKAMPEVIALNDPAEIVEQFDKPACAGRMAATPLPTPVPIGVIADYKHLISRMYAAGIKRVFLKLAHGSSASGTIAFRMDRDGERYQAFTTTEKVGDRLYNSRRVRKIEDRGEIAELVDSLARHRLYGEEWIPKATLPSYGAFDVRALVIAGRLRHVVGRCSRTPMTNLHLLNQRVPGERIRTQVGERAWAEFQQTAEAAARLYPRSLHVGLDIMWTPGFRHHYILEANAFGDQLNEVLADGETPYGAEIRALPC